ncbi:MAG: hypothetical protein ACLROR_14035, partial [Klebsiella michiganensis]
MTRYNTGYPVPSPAMPDVWDNNETIDSFVNSPESSVTTRTGIVRDTMFGMQKKADEQRIAASVALAEQMDSQESAFNAAQTDKEDRFQGFLNSSGYVFLGNYENGPFQFNARNQYIRYNNQYYRLNAATDVGFITTGTTAASFANDVTHFVLMDGDTLRANLGSDEGLKLVGQCAHLNALRAAEPSFSGQQIYLESLYSGWAATAAGMPWGGGKLRHIASLPEALRIDDGGCIFKTAAGNCWVREELLTGQGEIRVEWYMGEAPSFTYDASDAFQTAADTGKLWAQYSRRNKTVRLVMPAMMYITKTITVNTRGVRIDGNHGYCQVSSSGVYTAYNTLSSNSNITPTPDTGSTARAVINLTHGGGGSGVANPAYSDQELVKDWNLTLGVAGAGYNVLPLDDNGLAAFCHWGTSTVAAAQFSFRNVSTQGFGVGYINGDNTWGGNFYECKWVNCWIPMWLINGADNTERYTLFGCVMQNGYRCVYSPWGGDFNIVKGSYVWNTGPYFEFPKAGNMIE